MFKVEFYFLIKKSSIYLNSFTNVWGWGAGFGGFIIYFKLFGAILFLKKIETTTTSCASVVTKF